MKLGVVNKSKVTSLLMLVIVTNAVITQKKHKTPYFERWGKVEKSPYRKLLVSKK